MNDRECETIGGMIGRRCRSPRRNPTPVPLCPPQIPHDPTLAGVRAVTVGSQRLPARDMAWPFDVQCLIIYPTERNDVYELRAVKSNCHLRCDSVVSEEVFHHEDGDYALARRWQTSIRPYRATAQSAEAIFSPHRENLNLCTRFLRFPVNLFVTSSRVRRQGKSTVCQKISFTSGKQEMLWIHYWIHIILTAPFTAIWEQSVSEQYWLLYFTASKSLTVTKWAVGSSGTLALISFLEMVYPEEGGETTITMETSTSSELQATRDLEPISYRGALLSTLLHAIVYVYM
jgi:hypothetical protein